MQLAVDERPENWDCEVSRVCMAFRNTVNDTTCQTPFYLLLGYDPLMPIESRLNPQYRNSSVDGYAESLNQKLTKVYLEVSRQIDKKQLKYKKQHDKTISKRRDPIKVGDLVWIRTLEHLQYTRIRSKWKPKYKSVMRVISIDGYRVRVRGFGKPWGKDRRVHMDMIKKMLCTEEQYVAYLQLRDEEGRSDPDDLCYACGEMYVNGNREIMQEWVCCDADHETDRWFHLECVGLDPAPHEDEAWYCPSCLSGHCAASQR
jgi:hypothetical protein